jgi:hypothetical protein
VGFHTRNKSQIILLNKWSISVSRMIIKKLPIMLLVVLSAVSLIGAAYARGGVFVIEPTKEIIDSVELMVSDSTSANVCGSLSVVDGFVDFYVTSPSGVILLCYNRTALNRFNFTATENGTYVLHLRNTSPTNNVTATLNYGVNWQITLREETHLTWHVASVWQATIASPTPFDWIGFFNTYIYQFILASLPIFYKILEKLIKYWRERPWKKKYKEIRTPSDIKPWISRK